MSSAPLVNTGFRDQLRQVFSSGFLSDPEIIKKTSRSRRVYNEGDYPCTWVSLLDSKSTSGNSKLVYTFELDLPDGQTGPFEHHQHMCDKENGAPSQIGYEILCRALFQAKLMWQEQDGAGNSRLSCHIDIMTLNPATNMYELDFDKVSEAIKGKRMYIGIGTKEESYTGTDGITRTGNKNYFKGFK